MLSRDFQKIQMVRRLIHAERYDEARQMLKELQHPHVPILEEQLTRIIAEHTSPSTQPGLTLTRFGTCIGMIIGGGLLALNLAAGVHNLPFLLLNFALGFGIGCILPEHERRRQASREALLSTLSKRRSRYE